jgi:hypothetical protein
VSRKISDITSDTLKTIGKLSGAKMGEKVPKNNRGERILKTNDGKLQDLIDDGLKPGDTYIETSGPSHAERKTHRINPNFGGEYDDEDIFVDEPKGPSHFKPGMPSKHVDELKRQEREALHPSSLGELIKRDLNGEDLSDVEAAQVEAHYNKTGGEKTYIKSKAIADNYLNQLTDAEFANEADEFFLHGMTRDEWSSLSEAKKAVVYKQLENIDDEDLWRKFTDFEGS